MLTVGVDGSALGNPGPAGWAWYIDDSNWAAGGWEEATNNRGELTAIIKILEATQDTEHDLTILADSQYAINSITKWLPGWKKKGWKKSDGKPVVNQDLMIQLDELMSGATAAGRNITFQWIKGHAGHPLNEAADTRANEAAKAFQAGKPVKTGPGLTIDQMLQPPVQSQPERHNAKDTPFARVTVHTPLDKTLADEIVQRAQQRGVTPHEELARLIEAGMTAVYDTDQ
jgi:ribonuclease HI